MERAIPCELPFFYFRSAQFNSSKNITFVPNLQEIFKVAKRTFLYINLVVALFFVLPVLQAKEKTFTVVIDAGHGGKDPGARGSSINEKAINLAVALKLGSLISEKHNDVKVIYTRKTDVFIELDERANIANRNKADLFISIHTNAVKRGSAVSGTETYTLGLARTDENLEVAMRENSAILLEDNYLQKYEGFDPTSSERILFSNLCRISIWNRALAWLRRCRNVLLPPSVITEECDRQASLCCVRRACRVFLWN